MPWGWRPTSTGVSSGRRTRDQEQLAPVVQFPSHHTVVLYTRGLVRQYLLEEEIPHDYIHRIELPIIGATVVDFLLEIRRPLAMDTLHAVQTFHARNIIARTYVKFEYLGRLAGHAMRNVVFNDESVVAETSDFPILREVLDVPPIPWSEREERFAEIISSA